MTSRDTREYFIPSVPIEIPSEIVMVLNNIGIPLLFLIPLAVCSAKSLMCMLQGVTMPQVEATPTWDLRKSPFLKPSP